MSLFSKLSIFILCLLLLGISESVSCKESTGLRFYGQGHPSDERTSLQLFPKKHFKTSNQFSIEFDLAFERNYQSYFGYIFRMINEEGVNIDLIYYPDTLNLVLGDNSLSLSIPLSAEYFQVWRKVKVDIDIVASTYTLTVDNLHVQKNGDFLPLENKFEIIFGINHEKEIETIDLPNMTVRDILISQNYKNCYEWPLDEVEGSECLDVLGHRKAKVENPYWSHQDHVNWQMIHQIKTKSLSQIAYSSNENRFYIVTADSLISFFANGGRDYLKHPFAESVNLNLGNQVVYDSINEELIMYSVDEKIISKYDFDERKWSNNFSEQSGLPNFWHHNRFINSKDSTLRIIGGYGYLFYKNDYQTVGLDGSKWVVEETDPKRLAPRYLSGLGANSSLDTVYILGGYGSLSGDQKINPTTWHELIRHIPSTGEMERIFTYDDENINGFCFASSIIIHEGYFYALGFSKFEYNNYLQLYRGSLKSNELEPLGISIPFTFHDIMTNVDLYYSRQDEKLYTSVSFRNDLNLVDIKVYAINFPPEKFVMIAKTASNNRLRTHLFIIGILMLIYLIVWAILRNKRKRKAAESLLSTGKSDIVASDNMQELSGKAAERQKIIEEPLNDSPIDTDSKIKKNQILLFGGFQIIDSKGTDITGKFTPLLKEMFLIIFLNSFGERKGISSEYLREVLWGDKSDRDARNNRAVNLSKLRVILAEVGDSKIGKDTGYWKVGIDYSKVYVDYANLYQIVRSSKLDQKQILKITTIAKSKPFLNSITNEWLDVFKANVSNDIVDTLINWALENTENCDPNFIIPITDAVFEFDPINEEAMELKCRALVKLGKHSIAKKTFDSFKSSYEYLYGEKYNRLFSDVIE